VNKALLEQSFLNSLISNLCKERKSI